MINDNKFFIELFNYNHILNGLGYSYNHFGYFYIEIRFNNLILTNYSIKIYFRGKCIDLKTQQKMKCNKQPIYFVNARITTYNMRFEKYNSISIFHNNKTIQLLFYIKDINKHIILEQDDINHVKLKCDNNIILNFDDLLKINVYGTNVYIYVLIRC